MQVPIDRLTLRLEVVKRVFELFCKALAFYEAGQFAGGVTLFYSLTFVVTLLAPTNTDFKFYELLVLEEGGWDDAEAGLLVGYELVQLTAVKQELTISCGVQLIFASCAGVGRDMGMNQVGLVVVEGNEGAFEAGETGLDAFDLVAD